MGNFTYSATVTLTASDGALLQTQQQNVPANSKAVLDEIVAPGTVNLTPILAGLTTPALVYIVADGSGYTLTFDSLSATTKAQTMSMFQFFPTPSGPVTLTLTMQGSSQRLRVWAAGV